MSSKRVFLLVVLLLMAGSYLAGVWPQRYRIRQAQMQIAALQSELAEIRARERLHEILGQLLRVADEVEDRNFGDAADEAREYFDRIAGEIQVANRPDVRTALEEIRETRDLVTEALSKTEDKVTETLRQQQIELRRALGYVVPD
jgi:hypothetical protein